MAPAATQPPNRARICAASFTNLSVARGRNTRSVSKHFSRASYVPAAAAVANAAPAEPGAPTARVRRSSSRSASSRATISRRRSAKYAATFQRLKNTRTGSESRNSASAAFVGGRFFSKTSIAAHAARWF